MLRIYDEFLEDETILALKDRSYRLHVSALLYCARSVTDGEISDRAVKVLQALLGFAVKRHVAELVDAELWVPAVAGGYQIRNYLEFNPSSATVKAEKKKARERMRKLRERRATETEQESECSPERDAAHSPAVPVHTSPVLQDLSLAVPVPRPDADPDAIERPRIRSIIEKSLTEAQTG